MLVLSLLEFLRMNIISAVCTPPVFMMITLAPGGEKKFPTIKKHLFF